MAKSHGMCAIPEYEVWKQMKARCHNPENPRYADYGGRGISVCERWVKSFPDFLEDMGSRPSPRYSLDRIDNDGDYWPENCRWATRTEQQNNTRANVLISHDGTLDTLAGWARITGINPNSLRSRLKKGWPVEVALRLGNQHAWSRSRKRG